MISLSRGAPPKKLRLTEQRAAVRFDLDLEADPVDGGCYPNSSPFSARGAVAGLWRPSGSTSSSKSYAETTNLSASYRRGGATCDSRSCLLLRARKTAAR